MNTHALVRKLFGTRSLLRSRKATSRRRLALEALEERSLLSTFTVTSIADDGSAGTLRYEIEQANSNAGVADTIDFDPTVFATPHEITLTSGQLDLTDAATTTISGPGAGLLSISGNHASRVFFTNYGSAALSGLTITGGSAGSGGGLYNNCGTLSLTNCTVSGNAATNGGGVFTGGVYNYYGYTYSGATTLTNCTISGNSASNGGGVFTTAYGTTTLANTTVSGNSVSNNGGGGFTIGYYSMTTLSNCIVSGNSAGNNGGGLANLTGTLSASDGTTTLTGCSLSGNTAGNNGGGLYNRAGTATLTNCTVSSNFTGAFGGGVDAFDGTTSLTTCTVSDNSATNGAGLVNTNGTTTLTNCTVSGNSANSVGGGLYNIGGGSAALINCTVSDNSGYGGGLYNNDGGTLTLTNTIVAGNLSGEDISGGGGYSGTNNLIGGNPQLAPLGNYGGPTQTMALLPGSPAIDAGTRTGATATDQRGEGRVGAVDIGAFESQGFAFTLGVGSARQSSDIGMAFTYPLAVSVAANNPAEPVNGGIVNFVTNPVSGATAMLLGPSAVDIMGGQAAVSAAPNNALGSYTVVASAGSSFAGSFALTNMGTAFSSLIVNTTSDSPFPETGLLSLPEAVAFASVDTLGISSITFDPTVFATLRTITLSGSELELSNTSELETITGPAAGVTVDAGGLSRVVQVDRGGDASISGMTFSGGSAANGGGLCNSGTTSLAGVTLSGNSASYGGGLWNSGTATLTNCIVSGNLASRGGGVYSYYGATMLTTCTVSGNSATSGGGLRIYYGTTTLANCTVSGNVSSSNGGGLSLLGGTSTLTHCTVSGNSAVDSGGGLRDLSGTTTLTNCTLSGNSATAGGGLDSYYNTTTLTNCTVSGNSAGDTGGGLYNYGGATTLTNCTVSGDSAGSAGGGIVNTYYGSVTLGNTIVAANTAATDPDTAGGITSQGNNLIGKIDGSSGWVNSDLTGTIATPLNPLLASLGNFGGPTRTMALLPGSLAIDGGNNALIPAGVTTDQRGLPRIVNNVLDIGAFESSGFTIRVSSGSGQSAGVLTAFSKPLVVTVVAHNSLEPVMGGLVTFNPPISGPSAAINRIPAVLGATGAASVAAMANGIVGSDTVMATARGITTPATFSLKNYQLIVALDPSASAALSLSGNASINIAGVVYVDSRSASAISASGNARVKAAAIDVHGGVQKTGNASLSPAPVTGASVLAVALLPRPSTQGMTNYGSFSLGGNSSQTIQPGVYSSIRVFGNAKLTMGSGIYIIEGGGFSVSGNASVTGSGVMVFNAGSNYPGTGGTYGIISLGGNGACRLGPMTSGTYAGVVFFQPTDNEQPLIVTGNASGITGTTYAPGASLSESGNGSIGGSFIVDTITISGNGVARPGPLTSMNQTAPVLDQATPCTSAGTVPLVLKIKVTDALGNNVRSSRLLVVSMSVVGSAVNLVPQTPPAKLLAENMFTFDETDETYRFIPVAQRVRPGAGRRRVGCS